VHSVRTGPLSDLYDLLPYQSFFLFFMHLWHVSVDLESVFIPRGLIVLLRVVSCGGQANLKPVTGLVLLCANMFPAFCYICYTICGSFGHKGHK